MLAGSVRALRLYFRHATNLNWPMANTRSITFTAKLSQGPYLSRSCCSLFRCEIYLQLARLKSWDGATNYLLLLFAATRQQRPQRQKATRSSSPLPNNSLKDRTCRLGNIERSEKQSHLRIFPRVKKRKERTGDLDAYMSHRLSNICSWTSLGALLSAHKSRITSVCPVPAFTPRVTSPCTLLSFWKATPLLSSTVHSSNQLALTLGPQQRRFECHLQTALVV